MKKILLIPLVLTLFSSVIHAQKKDRLEWGSAVLEVAGAKLRLGMTKADVVEKLAGAPITKINENNWVVALPGKLGPSIQFTNGRLNFAERYWTIFIVTPNEDLKPDEYMLTFSALGTSGYDFGVK